MKKIWKNFLQRGSDTELTTNEIMKLRFFRYYVANAVSLPVQSENIKEPLPQ